MGMSFLFGKKQLKPPQHLLSAEYRAAKRAAFLVHGSKKLNILDKKVQNNAKNVECRIKRQYLRV